LHGRIGQGGLDVRRLGDCCGEVPDIGGDLWFFRFRRNSGVMFLLREREIGDRVARGDEGSWRRRGR
jgi:hypothetical protein